MRKATLRRSLRATLLAVAAACGVASLADGIKITAKPKKAAEIPEAGSNIENITSRFGKGGGDAADVPAFDVPQAPQQNNAMSPAMAKKMRELADKEKNWLVHSMTEEGRQEQDPAKKDQKSDVDEAFLEKKTKTTNERFFEEKEGKSLNSRRENRDDPDRRSRDPKDNPDDRRERGLDRETATELNINNYLSPVAGRESGFVMRDETISKGAFRAGFVGFERNNLSDPAKAAKDRAEEDRLNAFRKLIQTPGLTTTLGRDPLAAPTDLTRQETQPSAPKRNAEASQPQLLNPLAGGSGATYRIDRPSAAVEAAARMPGSSSLSPSFGAAFAPANLPAAKDPKPFEFEIPRRKF